MNQYDVRQEVLNVANYTIRKNIPHDYLIDNYSSKSYVQEYSNRVFLEFVARIYESTDTKEEVTEKEPKKTTITEWKEVYDYIPNSPLDYIKHGLYKFIPNDSFFPVFFPAKYKWQFIERIPQNTEIIEKTVVKKIRNIKNVYPDIRYDGERQKVRHTYDPIPCYPSSKNNMRY